MPNPRDRASWILAAALLILAPVAGISSDVPPVRCGTPDPLAEGGCIPGTGALHVSVDGQILQKDFPLKHTDVRAEVSGLVARVEVTQTYQNPYPETIEATYVFPLPHEAAVTDLEMTIGERVIRGLIERRETARQIYENARDRGQVAALLEQERPNIFTQSVANILPGNEIEIKLTYVETLEYERGTYEFAFPMVVGPRFNPPTSGGDVLPAGGFVPPRRSSVPDAERISPPYLPPQIRSGHDIAITVELDAGLEIRELTSPTHAIETDRSRPERARVRLSELDDIPNKDFVLRYRVDGDGPETAVMTHHDGERGFVTVAVHPKVDLTEQEITPKEMIFVLDCSGSMSGEPMAAAKELVRHSLRNMRPVDSFQIIRFSSNASGLSPRPVACTADNVRRGLSYIDQLRGGGGTMMIEGIKAALDFPSDPDRLRIVMFLTDGYIGNENEILAAIRDRIGGARLFSFGVGSSVNRFLLDRMAEEGRGEVEYHLPGSAVAEAVSTFYARIRNPYLTDVELVWNGVEVDDALPARIPDLFEGRPLVVHATYEDGASGELVVRGNLAGRPWSKRVKVRLPDRPSGNPAIGSLWARAHIADLERAQVRGERPEIVEEITQLGLAHRLVTKYTSFVAVEETMVVSDGRPKTVRVPLEMPEGVSYEGVFGQEKKDAVGGRHRALGHAGGPAAPSLTQAWGSVKSLNEVEVPRAMPVEMDRKVERTDGGDRTEESRRLLDSLDPDESAAALRLHLAADRTQFAVGETIALTVTFENTGATTVTIPDRAAATRGELRLRILDGKWNATTLGRDSATTTRLLAPGETVEYEITIDPAHLSALSRPGVLHLILDGAASGARDSNRVTIEIVAR